ncbi:hypothetical protein ES708_01100 [subsurface metagenome]
MSYLTDTKEGASYLVMGNEAIVRGALEAGVNVASGYPGTPSSEIIESFSKVAGERNLYVEWSVNEKVALEVAAAASFAQLRALCAMKQNGVNVASDFLLHLVGSGTRGGFVLVTCDDPGALSVKGLDTDLTGLLGGQDFHILLQEGEDLFHHHDPVRR